MDEIEQLLDDDGDMSELYLSRKLDGVSSPSSRNGLQDASPTFGSKKSRASGATIYGDHDVEELEMLLEVVDLLVVICLFYRRCRKNLLVFIFVGLLYPS